MVSLVTPFFLIGLVLLPFWARSLNLLTLGDRETRHLGVSTERVRLSVIGLSALVTGAAVSVAGIIGFVGLVVPHVIRLVVGPDHRFLLAASILGGATALLLAAPSSCGSSTGRARIGEAWNDTRSESGSRKLRRAG